MKTIAILNGPNLNLLGTREPDLYGTQTLADIERACTAWAQTNGCRILFRQTNHEGELVTWIHDVRHNCDGLILNAAAYTHTSVALHDALKTLTVPIIEVHLTNPHAREPFRHTSYVAPIARAVIAGCGAQGYVYALEQVIR